MGTVRLFATDLDGTLLRPDRTVSPRAARAMTAARSVGVEVVWATARARHSVHEFARSCGFRGIALCANGAVVVDLADGTPRIVSTVAIDDDAAAAAIDRVRTAVPGVVFAAVGPSRFVAEDGYAALTVFADHHRDPVTMDRAGGAYPWLDQPCVKIVARHPTIPSEDVYASVAAAGIDGVEITHSGAPYVEMSASGVSKASALAALCADRGIDAAEVAAAGDARNDLAMLRWVGTALCPENAIDEVRAVADRVLPGNDADGIASYLEELAGHRGPAMT